MEEENTWTDQFLLATMENVENAKEEGQLPSFTPQPPVVPPDGEGYDGEKSLNTVVIDVGPLSQQNHKTSLSVHSCPKGVICKAVCRYAIPSIHSSLVFSFFFFFF
ncbi:hypothetical protein TorRG33x02_190960 [Trema orientale]|uniref:Uncharacterized protein n=1 Tax=Trema orientale TaxID=63057 RepID=A0A2P5EHU9_TREOI|nr:hypothetical protein TorRG33x02_190960 [Trema orientale]